MNGFYKSRQRAGLFVSKILFVLKLVWKLRASEEERIAYVNGIPLEMPKGFVESLEVLKRYNTNFASGLKFTVCSFAGNYYKQCKKKCQG